MADITLKQLNKMLANKGLEYYQVFKECGEYKLKYGIGMGYGVSTVQFSSKDILTVRDYIQEMK